MATNRILEFTPSQEEAIVARVLVLVHQAVDEHFPSAEKATRQFTKTVFSEDGSERTAAGASIDPNADTDPRGRPGAVVGAFGNEEKTGPGRDAGEGGSASASPNLPPVPVAGAAGGNAARTTTPPPPSHPSRPNPNISRHEVSRQESHRADVSNASRSDASGIPGLGAVSGAGVSGVSGVSGMSGMTGLKGGGLDVGPDWVTRATLVLLVAGLVLLAYSLLS